jgi:hypothetical protein
MSPTTGPEDYFESQYTEKFRAIVGSRGIFLRYEKDLAGIDLGLHLYEPGFGNELSASTTRIWFQLKGLHGRTCSKKKLLGDRYATVSMRVSYMKYYYFMPEPVFLVLYLEAIDRFVVADLRNVVEEQLGGVRFFSSKKSQKTVSFKISLASELNEAFWTGCHSYRSFSVHPPLFRGRSLGHRLDPLRCSLDKLDPLVFLSLVHDLLAGHQYSITTELSASELFGSPLGNRRLTVGRLFQTWEWSWHLSHEFLGDEDTGFRKEGQILQKQGLCATLVDGDATSFPDQGLLKNLISRLVSQQVDELLVFANTHDARYFGAFFAGVRGSTVRCTPQLLADIPYNLLQNHIVFKKYIHKIEWHSLFYL